VSQFEKYIFWLRHSFCLSLTMAKKDMNQLAKSIVDMATGDRPQIKSRAYTDIPEITDEQIQRIIKAFSPLVKN
jgi:hypothetical protein